VVQEEMGDVAELPAITLSTGSRIAGRPLPVLKARLAIEVCQVSPKYRVAINHFA
jgi:hypothetical protein